MKRLTLTTGAALVLVGAYELIDSTNWSSMRATITWFLGGTLLHDLVVVPLTLLFGFALTQLVPRVFRSLAQGALVVSATLTLALFPLLSGQGRTASNPSQQPLPYGRNLVLVLATVWICAGVLAFRRHRRRRPLDHGPHQPSRPRQSDAR